MQKLLTRKRNKGFTLIELIVVIAVIAILVFLAMPKFLDYTREAKITQIKNDVKVVENIVEIYMIRASDTLPPNGTAIEIAAIKAEVVNNKVFNKKGLITDEANIVGDGFEILDESFIKRSFNSKLSGYFVANNNGIVYYIHDKAIIIGDSGEPNEDDDEIILCSAIPEDQGRPINIPWNDIAVGSGAMFGGEDLTFLELLTAMAESFSMDINDEIANAKGYNISGERYLFTQAVGAVSIRMLTEYFFEYVLISNDDTQAIEDAILFGATTQERINEAGALFDAMIDMDFKPIYTAQYNEDGTIIGGDEGCILAEDEGGGGGPGPIGGGPDTTDYYDLLDNVNESDYTTVSWSDYMDVVNANTINENSTQEEIDTAYNNIAAAQNNLIVDTNKSYFTWTVSNGKAEITGLTYQGSIFFNKELIIPNTLDGYPVTSIGNSAFMSKELISVEIPESINNIKDNAFYDNRLVEVIIPNSVITIGYGAFAGNWTMTSLQIGESVEIIGGNAFSNNLLTEIIIPDSVITIGNNAFENSGSLTSNTTVRIGNSVKTIGNNAFHSCRISSLDLGSSVETIGMSAFFDNHLSSVIIPNSVKTINNTAFDANKLTYVSIGRYVNSIGFGVFARNPDLMITVDGQNDDYMSYEGGLYTKNGLTILSGAKHQANKMLPGIEEIARSSFYGNELTIVEIPNSVTSIGSSAFYRNELSSVTIPNSVTTIGDNAFSQNGPSKNSQSLPLTGPWTGTWNISGTSWVKQ